MNQTELNSQIVRFIAEQYPHGIPARLLKSSSLASNSENRLASVVFSGPSASKLAIVFFEERADLSMARDLVVKAITSGLKRSVAEVLLVQCSPGTPTVSLRDCSPKSVLVAGAEASLVSDFASAAVITTDPIKNVLIDPEAKKRFWHALQKAWETSQKS